jgi:outer membrane receptor for ferrienterochelin and colicin
MERQTLVWALGLIVAISALAEPGDGGDLFSLSFEELQEIRVTGSSTLLDVSGRRAPAAVTVITAEQIQRSGARNMDELLDIYVPGFQYMPKLQANMIGM